MNYKPLFLTEAFLLQLAENAEINQEVAMEFCSLIGEECPENGMTSKNLLKLALEHWDPIISGNWGIVSTHGGILFKGLNTLQGFLKLNKVCKDLSTIVYEANLPVIVQNSNMIIPGHYSPGLPDSLDINDKDITIGLCAKHILMKVLDQYDWSTNQVYLGVDL